MELEVGCKQMGLVKAAASLAATAMRVKALAQRGCGITLENGSLIVLRTV